MWREKAKNNLSFFQKNLYEKNPDFFLTSLFSSSSKRWALLRLYSFHFQLLDILITVQEPTLRCIRYQWWIDVLKNIDDVDSLKQHDFLPHLHDLVQNHFKSAQLLIDFVEGYLFFNDSSLTLNETCQQFDQIKGQLFQLALYILDGQSLHDSLNQGARHMGVAYGLIWMLRYPAFTSFFIPIKDCQNLKIDLQRPLDHPQMPDLSKKIYDRVMDELNCAEFKFKDFNDQHMPLIFMAKLTRHYARQLKKSQYQVQSKHFYFARVPMMRYLILSMMKRYFNYSIFGH